MITIEVPSKEVCVSQVSKSFAHADDYDQAYFLMGIPKNIDFGKWVMQCRFIAESIAWNPPHNTPRKEVIAYLETLIEHLKEAGNE